MKKTAAFLFCFCIALGLSALEIPEKPKTKKELRELSPDRPHQTGSPHTVDAGHIMFETDLVNHTRKNNDVPNSRTTGLFYFNFKVGIQKNMGLEVMSNAY